MLVPVPVPVLVLVLSAGRRAPGAGCWHWLAEDGPKAANAAGTTASKSRMKESSRMPALRPVQPSLLMLQGMRGIPF